MRIGKAAENDLVLPDASISRFHATLDLLPDGLLLKDLESTNGTFVRGLRIHETRLPAADEITLGDVRLEIRTNVTEHVAIPDDKVRFHGLVGRSPRMRDVFALIRAVARSPVTVLVLGETGTGKEMVARALHQESGAPGELVAFDCASTQRDLIRAELFGHTRGAFTGAASETKGACRLAHKGTLFLDEIGELPIDLQPNLLRVIETREVKPLGSERAVPIDTRLVAATHRDLDSFVKEGRFRQDLYHRLRVVELVLPALRERTEDIAEIIAAHAEQSGLTLDFSPASLDRLREYRWPGNVRELRNALDRLGVTVRDRTIVPSDLDFLETHSPIPLPPSMAPGAPAGGDLQQLERRAIEDALRQHNGNRDLAAQAPGISRATLYRRLKEYRED